MKIPDAKAAVAKEWTQVRMEDAPNFFKKSKVRMSRHIDTSSTTQGPKSLSNIEDLVVPLERNLYGHPLAGLHLERQFEKVLLEPGWEKVPDWECPFVQRKQGLFFSVYVDDLKNDEKHNTARYKRARDIGGPAHTGALIGARPRTQAMIQDAVTAGLLQSAEATLQNSLCRCD